MSFKNKSNKSYIMPSDTYISVCLNTDIKDLPNLCRSNREINNICCDNEHFWHLRLKNDYPELYKEYKLKTYEKSFKKLYKNIYLPSNYFILEWIDEFINADELEKRLVNKEIINLREFELYEQNNQIEFNNGTSFLKDIKPFDMINIFNESHANYFVDFNGNLLISKTNYKDSFEENVSPPLEITKYFRDSLRKFNFYIDYFYRPSIIMRNDDKTVIELMGKKLQDSFTFFISRPDYETFMHIRNMKSGENGIEFSYIFDENNNIIIEETDKNQILKYINDNKKI